MNTPEEHLSCYLPRLAARYPQDDEAQIALAAWNDMPAQRLQRLHAAVQEAGVDGGIATSDAIEALEAHQRGAAVAIKPLVWTEESETRWQWITHTARLEGRVIANVIQTASRYLLVGGGIHRGGEFAYSTLEAAKAAAQAEWSAFVLAALQP